MRVLPEDKPLWQVFWLYGVVLSHILWGGFMGLVYTGMGVTGVAVLSVPLLIYTGWIIAAVWAAADNVENPSYGLMARGLTVAWGLNTIFVIGFLLGDLSA
jgi:hypothetical protein